LITEPFAVNPCAATDKRKTRQPLRALTAEEQQLVLDNLGLARKEANRIAGILAARMPFNARKRVIFQQFYEDLEQAGVTGLCVAAQRFDPSRGFKFSSFACWWIRGYVQQAAQICELRSGTVKFRRRSVIQLFTDQEIQTKKGTVELEIWDDRSEESEPVESKASIELMTLLNLVVGDKRRAKIVAQNLIEGKSYKEIGEMMTPPITKQRVSMLFDDAYDKLRNSKIFLKTLLRMADKKDEKPSFNTSHLGGAAQRIA
jgi:RNA polymerase sigma factor (sigma-70 family)